MYKFSVLEKFVGFFVFVSLVLVIVIAIFLGRAGEWFRPSINYYTLLSDVSDVSSGKKIYYRGIVVGKVSRVSVYNDELFRVDLYIYSEYTNIVRSDSLIIVRSELLGGKKFELIPGSQQSDYLKKGQMIYSPDTYEGKILAKLKGYYSPQEDINKIINNISLITSYLVDYVGEEGELRKVLVNVNGILKDVDSSIKGINYNTLPALNNVLSRDIPLVVDNLIGVLEQLQVILKSQNISNSIKNIEKITKDISDITDSLSKNKTNINNVVVNLEKLTKNLNEILEFIRGK